MKNGIHQKKELPPRDKLSYSLATRAEEEMLEKGEVFVRCPKCGELPIVDRDSHRVYVKCPCGFVRKAVLLEI